MPIYEYECTKCGNRSEVLQKFSDKPISKCDVCNGKMKKLISHSAFHLKGTGWYVTDYASKSTSPNSAPSPAAKKEPYPASDSKPVKAKSKSTAKSANKDA